MLTAYRAIEMSGNAGFGAYAARCDARFGRGQRAECRAGDRRSRQPVLVEVDDRAVGVLTIRDILIRLVAAGLDPTATPVSQVMSSSLFTCTEEDAADSVVERMAEHRIEQMPVLDAGGRLVGMITRRAAETFDASSTAQ